MLVKMEVLLKNGNFEKKSKMWPKIEILYKIKIFFKNRNFGQKSNFWLKMEILVKHRNFGQKSKFWLKIKIFVKNQNFDQKSKTNENNNILNFLLVWIKKYIYKNTEKVFLFELLNFIKRCKKNLG